MEQAGDDIAATRAQTDASLAADRARLETRRENTDDRLSTERTSWNVAGAALDETRSALAAAASVLARASDVFATVTRDLRTPLGVIAVNAQSIVEETREASTREAAQDVARAAARMDLLLTDLLDVARIESGTLRIVKRPQDVGTLVKETLRSYRPLFAARGMTFAVGLPAAAVLASFDHDRIAQVLSRVLSNAMEFTPPDGTIFLRLERRGEQVELGLSDTGPGIHPDALPHVFERFWHVDGDAHRGLGLGLYICQRIVEAHGGRIWAESDYGNGATFRFTLPSN